MNTLHQIVEPHTPTPAAPDIPALVEVLGDVLPPPAPVEVVKMMGE